MTFLPKWPLIPLPPPPPPLAPLSPRHRYLLLILILEHYHKYHHHHYHHPHLLTLHPHNFLFTWGVMSRQKYCLEDQPPSNWFVWWCVWRASVDDQYIVYLFYCERDTFLPLVNTRGVGVYHILAEHLQLDSDTKFLFHTRVVIFLLYWTYKIADSVISNCGRGFVQFLFEPTCHHPYDDQQ